MLSRVADSIYWMQRYRERAENIARLIDVNLFLNIDAPGDDRQQWHPSVVTTGDYDLFEELYGEPTESNVLQFLTFDPRNPNSILNCVSLSRENARSIRETITSEMWHEINLLYLHVREAAAAPKRALKHPFEFYAHIRRSCQLFTGIMDTTLSHDEAWHFGRLGNLFERADQSSRILDAKYYILLPSVEHVGSPYDDILWAALLKSVSGLEMYRRSWNEIRHSHVVDFIVLNPDFPRSIHSCLRRAQDSLRAIGGGTGAEDEPLRLLIRMCGELERTHVYDIVKFGLHEFLDQVQSKISEISQSMYNTYFSPFPASPQASPVPAALAAGSEPS